MAILPIRIVLTNTIGPVLAVVLTAKSTALFILLIMHHTW